MAYGITKRIDGILSLCISVKVVADIGCDHGLTCAGLLERGLAEYVIATDISKKSVKKAKHLFMKLGLEAQTDIRIGSGLCVLERGEADGIILSGMGGPLITEILASNLEVAKETGYMIISPHSYPERVRMYLVENGFDITKEKVVCDAGKYYPIMRAEPGERQPYSAQELLLGKTTCQDETYIRFLKDSLSKQTAIRKHMEQEKVAFAQMQPIIEKIEMLGQALYEAERGERHDI